MSNKFSKNFKKIASEKKPHLSERKLLKNIKKGFENQEFKMYLQFIVDSKQQKIASAETLSRWENAAGEVVFPGTYIGIMEKSGLITRFDYYMFEMVCKKLSQWKDTELADVTLSCNLTRITISEKDFVEKIKEISNRLNWKRDVKGRVSAIIDSAANQKTLASNKSVCELFYDNGILVNPKVNKDVFSGIERVKQYLNKEGVKPKLYIFKSCSNLIRELKSYRWGKNDNPIKTDDHSLDALRYYIMTTCAYKKTTTKKRYSKR